jgi:hypothetical protein
LAADAASRLRPSGHGERIEFPPTDPLRIANGSAMQALTALFA